MAMASSSSNSEDTIPPIVDVYEKEGDSVANEEVVSTAASSKGKGKARRWSKIWDDFHLIPAAESSTGSDEGKCKHCGKQMSAVGCNGTSNMKRHLPKCLVLHNDASVLLSASARFLDRKLDQEHFRDLLAIAVIQHNYPLNIVEHEHLRNALSYLNPDVIHISRNTLKAVMLRIYKREKARVRDVMHRIPGKICITSDMWTSPTTRGYLSLTAHFVDVDWKLRSVVLNFIQVPPPHSAINMHNVIYDLLKQWGIENKIFSITLDNARSNDNMAELLRCSLNVESRLPCDGKFFHVRCCAHVLNLVVQDGLAHIDDSAITLRDGIKYVDWSEGRKLNFIETAKRAGCNLSKGLWLDCVTRWNSTHAMLDRALIYRAAFEKMAKEDKNGTYIPMLDRALIYRAAFEWNLNDEEWVKVEKIVALLRPFSEITTLFSGTKYPTANLYFGKVFDIETTLIKVKSSEEEYLREMATSMKEKFNKYWGDCYNLVLAFGVILDPRYKLDYVRFCYMKLNPNNYLMKTNVILDSMKQLFGEYQGESSIGVPSTTNTDATSSRSAIDAEFDLFEPSRLTSSRSELQVFLDEGREPRTDNFEILKWWETNERRYPNLTRMARDILSIPITTVASESAFSLGGRVLTKLRHNLLPENAEALITTKSWLSSEENINVVAQEDLVEEIVLSSNEVANEARKRARTTIV